MPVLKMNVNNYNCRAAMVNALAMSGYKVWVEEEQNTAGYLFSNTSYFVCFEVGPSEVISQEQNDPKSSEDL